MKKIILLFVSVVFLMINSGLSQDFNAPINPDPNVKIGKLPNGLTYYLRANKKPEKRIEFRMAVKAGSVQEDDNQQGLAHYTEHMGFNGIKGYPGNNMVSELQKIGVTFGADVNAYTSFDRTVYMVQIPSDNPKNLKMGLDILFGWSNGMLMDNKEIDDERGVISEEWRMGQGASDRMMKKWLPIVFSGSKLGERLPIGKIEVIKNFDYSLIKKFYKDWYRPDIEALVIVGDINVTEVEKEIINRFSKIKMPKAPRPVGEYPIANNKEPQIAICSDVEAMGTSFFIARKFPHFVMKTIGDYKQKMINELYSIMYESRLDEYLQNPTCPLLSGNVGYSDLIGGIDVYMLSASVKENKLKEALNFYVQEESRILKYGFLETELKRAKIELLNRYENFANEVEKTESEQFANEYVQNFLMGDPVPGAKREYAYAKKYLESITLEEVNMMAAKWITKENTVVVIELNENADVVIPSEDDVLKILNNNNYATIEAYIDNYKEQEVIDMDNLILGTVVEKIEYPDINVQRWSLSNGIQVLVKKTDFKKEEISFTANSYGGYSLYPVEDIPTALLTANMIDRAGIGELNFSSLQKKLKGKKIELVPSITPVGESLSGTTAPKDLEFFCQYINAFFTNIRKDENVKELVITQIKEQLKKINANPMYKFIAAFFKAATYGDPYLMNLLTISDDEINKVNYKRALEIYKDRFSNPADFVFCFVGNFDEKILEEYVNKYIASLPTTNNHEMYDNTVFLNVESKKIESEIYAGMDNKSWVGLEYSGKYDYNLKNNTIIKLIGDAVNIETVETLREKMGGIYSPMLQTTYEKDPSPEYVLFLIYSCLPDNTEKLFNASLEILKEFSQIGPKAETLAKVKEQAVKSLENNLQKNDIWSAYLVSQYMQKDDMSAINQKLKTIQAITNEDIVNFMKQYVNIDNYLKLVMFPESKQGN